MTLKQEYPTAPTNSTLFGGVSASVDQVELGPAGPLVNNANRCAPTVPNLGQIPELPQVTALRAAVHKELEAKQARRLQQFRARGVLHSLSSLSRVRTCGAVSVRPEGTVDLMLERAGGVPNAFYSGLASCGSVWSCPVCSERIQSERREQVRKLLDFAEKEGLTSVFGTMTLRHDSRKPLAQTWGALSGAFAAVARDKTVRRLRTALGHQGYLRIVEVTHGQNGWHPHIHNITLFAKKPTEQQLQELADAEFRVWKKVAQLHGLGAPVRERYDLQLVKQQVEDYFTKTTYRGDISAKSLSFEVQGGSSKSGRGGSRTSFEILADLVEHRRPEDLKLWHEFEQVSRGKRALTWSQGLKKWAGIEDEQDEDQNAPAEPDEDDHPPKPVVTVLGHRALRGRGVAAAAALSLVERGNSAQHVREWFADWGIETIEVGDPRALADRVSMLRLEFHQEVDSLQDVIEQDAQDGCELVLLDVLSETLAAASQRP